MIIGISLAGILSDELTEFLNVNLPKGQGYQLGVGDPKLGAAIQESMKATCLCDDYVQELFRGIRFHFHSFIELSLPGL